MVSRTHIGMGLPAEVSQAFLQLESHFLTKSADIAAWFAAQWQQTPAPLYGSVDLRNAGFKLAPVDMNLFPAGFNNLNPDFLHLSVTAAKKAIRRHYPKAMRILIVPESHTRNLFYWDNIHTIKTLLVAAGFDVRVGFLGDPKDASEVTVTTGDRVKREIIKRVEDKIMVDGFQPELILLNNDLSEGIPPILQALSQPIAPPAEIGWSQRLKSAHFQFYQQVAEEFAAFLKIDPWLIAPLFKYCGKIDFLQQEGMQCVIDQATLLLEAIKQKYETYGIKYQPFIVVKSDTGTYGMAVMTVRNTDELKALNRKQRTRMAMTKGGQPVRRVIIQEGIYTFEAIGESRATAEPVVYLWGEEVVGGFYRVHQARGVDENLNAPGMHFAPLPFPESCQAKPDDDHHPYQNCYFLYGVLAQLSMLAAAREIERL